MTPPFKPTKKWHDVQNPYSRASWCPLQHDRYSAYNNVPHIINEQYSHSLKQVNSYCLSLYIRTRIHVSMYAVWLFTIILILFGIEFKLALSFPTKDHSLQKGNLFKSLQLTWILFLGEIGICLRELQKLYHSLKTYRFPGFSTADSGSKLKGFV